MRLRKVAWSAGVAITGRVARLMLRAPSAWMGKALGAPAPSGLDLQTWAVLRSLELTRTPGYEKLGVRGARRAMDLMAPMLEPRARSTVRSRDETIAGPAGAIPIRIYEPRGAAGLLPLVMWFHGGGFVMGSLRSHDGLCRYVCECTGCRVVAVDYRLAPEHRFPAALDDALCAFRWAGSHAALLGIDPERIAVAGDSAGGNLSAVIALTTREEAVHPRLQVLIYPPTDMTRSLASHREFAAGFFLDKPLIDWFLECYLPDAEAARDPRCSPLFWEDLSGAAPALIATAGFDPLRDEGKAYAERLSAAGVKVTHGCHQGLIHGFVSMAGGITAAGSALDDACRVIRDELSG